MTTSRMTRIDATRLLAARLGNRAVVANLGHTAYDLFAASDRPGNFYTWGSMGVVSSIALGLALARPDLGVVALDGDGSLLMNLGTLATIGRLQPPNLLVIVWDNEEYATTGGQLTPTAGGADLAAAARAMGIAAVSVNDLPRFGEALEEADREGRTMVIVAKVLESRPTGRPPLDCVFIKQRFMAGVGNPERSTCGAS
jgi:thiamine pyrophosphate-dependent acetolactate synthase large subunit-like protein